MVQQIWSCTSSASRSHSVMPKDAPRNLNCISNFNAGNNAPTTSVLTPDGASPYNSTASVNTCAAAEDRSNNNPALPGYACCSTLCPCGGAADPRTSKFLRQNYDGHPSKVFLYPEEGWAKSATNAYWLLSMPWWSRSRCKVVEVAGTRRSTTHAKVVDTGNGVIHIMGSFKNSPEPDFKLSLSSHVTPADFNMGYGMTGTLERGCYESKGSLQLTHFAVLRRHEF